MRPRALTRALLLSSAASLAGFALAPQSSAQPAARSNAPDGAPARRVTVAASGDLLLHIKVVKAARDQGWDRVFRGLRQLLGPDEIGFANLETPLVDDVRDVHTGSPPTLGAPPEAAAALARSGLDVVGCANNHSWDQAAVGLARTVEALEAAGVVPVGAHVEEEAAYGHRVVERGGLRVAFLSYT
ncbi:MAG TPA: CapA family protein, partial [Polyangiaceae bacterium LLY-WYZ-15_(1-7)]|nr:CapA family protein [Polyangiaceae bacterium LLY-WYZ-15_(1-7)]